MNNLTDDDEINLRIEADPLIGQILAGQYKVLSVVGAGGMGVVYQGEHLGMGRPVAIKTLHIGRAADNEALKRFHLEAKAASRVQHPNTVSLYDFGVSDEGQPFLVMELLSGISLRKVFKENGPLGLSQVNSIVQQIVAALTCAHEALVVHKDLKPENIMLSEQSGQTDWVHILDFGIAGMVDPADLYKANDGLASKKAIGSPPYMSPEQCANLSEIGPCSDIYSLAVLAFEALCGKFPFKARSAMEMLECHISASPFLLKEMGPNFSTYESLTTVLSKALEKLPEKRYQTAVEFGRDFEIAVSRDSVRGMALKDRIGFEAPRSEEFISRQEGDTEPEEIDPQKEKSVRQFLSDLVGKEKESAASQEGGARKYQVFTCPRCGAQNQEDLALCLSCGRSLASTNDFSRIRVAKGDFSLPKYQEVKQGTSRSISQKTRMSMLRSGRVWSRNHGLILISIILLVCVFLYAGGAGDLTKTFRQWFSPGSSGVHSQE